MKRIIGWVLLLAFSNFGKSQQFGGNPASVKWQQINTDTVRIIFPKGYQSNAERIASIVLEMQKTQTSTVGAQFRKINIVIQNQNLVSNGYVGLAPFRSEFYVTPPQNAFILGAVNWSDMLAVHEFRHVQQFNNYRKGLSKIASFLLGEQGQLVTNAMSVPDWFFEGDAVYNETRLTTQGRGVLPSFLAAYQSLYQSGKKYSYQTLRNGSYRNYIPDHYALGYLLVAYGRNKYGDGIWQKITDDAVRFRPLFYPFQGALTKYTGVSFPGFVSDALQFYQKQWQDAKPDTVSWLTRPGLHDLVQYQYPYTDKQGGILVMKSSNRALPAFYHIQKNGSESKIAVRQISQDTYFSYNNGVIVYAAFQPDQRWGNRNFHSIVLLNIKDGKEETLVKRSLLVSPDIAHNGREILAVDQLPDGNTRLLRLNREGTIIDSINKSETVFAYPKFSDDDQFCYVTERNRDGQMSLVKYALHGKKAREELFPASNRIIGFPQVQGDTLLFTTTYEGRDEIWAIIDSQPIKGPFRLASYPSGLYQATLLPGGSLVASAFTADGYRLGKFQPQWQRVALKDELQDLYVGNLYNEQTHEFVGNRAIRSFPVSTYPKSFHLLNFHSYRPYYDHPEYSFTIYGENVLNTFQSELAYTYNSNEQSHKAGFTGIYGGSFVEPFLSVNQTWHRTGLFRNDTTVHWNEWEAGAGLQLPLNLTSGRHFRNLTISGSWNNKKVNWTGLGAKLLPDRSFSYQETRITYSTQIQKALQQIYPHWATYLFVKYRSILNTYTAHQFLASGSLYLPGLANNHSLVINAAFHNRDTLQQYQFSNDFPFSRGYNGVDFPSMWKWGVNYHFPLAFPDWGFGNLIYFLRVRANLFYDETTGKSRRTGITYPFRTVGTELFFDTRWWNQQPVTFGIRYSRLLDNVFSGITHPNVWELILPINLIN